MDFNKDLIAASSTPIVLAILSEGDSYGYAIIKRVQELSGGHLEWTDGMLYPVLHRLERLGYIKARWEESETGRRRKYYRITSQGKAQLAEERKQWQAVDATLKGIWKSLSRMAISVSANDVEGRCAAKFVGASETQRRTCRRFATVLCACGWLAAVTNVIFDPAFILKGE